MYAKFTRPWIWLLAALLLVACEPEEAPHSDLYKEVLQPQRGGLFRGADMGMELAKVQELEGKAPKHDDRYGYVYEFILDDKRKYFVEYIATDPEKRIIQSMLTNVFLDEESAATDLFNEIGATLKEQYGTPESFSGLMKWYPDGKSYRVSLRILDDKKSLSLQYIPLEGF